MNPYLLPASLFPKGNQLENPPHLTALPIQPGGRPSPVQPSILRISLEDMGRKVQDLETNKTSCHQLEHVDESSDLVLPAPDLRQLVDRPRLAREHQPLGTHLEDFI